MARKNEPDWAEAVKRYLKAELKRADLTYEELAERMKKAGIEETAASVANKLSRGTFSAAFFFAVAKAAGVEQVRIADMG